VTGAALAGTDTARPACPKEMTYGPCGGVAPDGGCETGAGRCAFLDVPLPRWSGGTAPEPADAFAGMRRPLVIADLPARALDLASLRECTAALAGAVDAVLLGDHGGERVQFPPALRAHWVQARGVRVWAGLTCRDRNRVALEGEIAGLAEVGVAGVHCVTGDHTVLGHRPDAKAVFDLDSTRLVALAAAGGLPVSVAENPGAPPADRRPARLAEKVRAGAGACFVNHTTGPAAVREFTTAAVTAGAAVPFVACVPIVLDEATAAVLRSFTGLHLPPGYVEGVLGARDPLRAGVAAAVALSQALLDVPGVRGVNLSGGGGPDSALAPATVAGALATVARALR
jgi:5,10-methylenetetrahydrofolate reductase